MDPKALAEAGLTTNEAKIYLSLLKKHIQQAGDIAKRTEVHRRNVYDALERLIEKGLVRYVIKGKRKFFSAEPPNQLLKLLKQKQESISSIMPRLQVQYDSSAEETEAHIYRGTRGLKTVLEDQINSGKEILVYGAYGDFDKILKFYLPQFERKRIKKGVKVKLIFDETQRKKFLSSKYVSAKYLPKFFAGPVATNIYGDKVAIILWIEQPIVIMIHSKEVARSYKKYFSLIWNLAKK